ncbi:hypothetical protein SS50377_28268 [Spironucleus salmonicida]|uniref:Uncharacterized protein n=1 Tax=Spironucleus salmonicida TaxID=348837 RepID=V6LXK2_9EUKA|nr:hypothetical protein SS50377_28268 [Spironucleus salmonicida]|eukprot:EST48446.1 Hypothetical protein SS50377_11396 [Spironucleus salmonicida]
MPPKKAPLDPLQYLFQDLRIIKYIQQTSTPLLYKQNLHKQLFPQFEFINTDSRQKDIIQSIQNEIQMKQSEFSTLQIEELPSAEQVNTFIGNLHDVTNQLTNTFKLLSYDKHIMELNNVQIVPIHLFQKISSVAQQILQFEQIAQDLKHMNEVVAICAKVNIPKLKSVIQ